MVTVKNVARKARVSTATVSHVINETRFVSEDLRVRVHQAIEELGYRPNAVAQSLRRKRTKNIAMIIPDIAYPLSNKKDPQRTQSWCSLKAFHSLPDYRPSISSRSGSQ